MDLLEQLALEIEEEIRIINTHSDPTTYYNLGQLHILYWVALRIEELHDQT